MLEWKEGMCSEGLTPKMTQSKGNAKTEKTSAAGEEHKVVRQHPGAGVTKPLRSPAWQADPLLNSTPYL